MTQAQAHDRENLVRVSRASMRHINEEWGAGRAVETRRLQSMAQIISTAAAAAGDRASADWLMLLKWDPAGPAN